MKHEYFTEFKETFNIDFKEKENNYPKVIEEEDRSVSVIINDNPFLFLKGISKNNNADEKNHDEDKDDNLNRKSNTNNINKSYLPNYESSSEDEEDSNIFGTRIRKRKNNAKNSLPTFSKDELDGDLGDLEDSFDGEEDDKIENENFGEIKNTNNEIVGRKRGTKNVINLPPKFEDLGCDDLNDFSFEDDEEMEDSEIQENNDKKDLEGKKSKE